MFGNFPSVPDIGREQTLPESTQRVKLYLVCLKFIFKIHKNFTLNHLYIVIVIFFKMNTLSWFGSSLCLVKKLAFQESASCLFSAFMYPLAHC